MLVARRESVPGANSLQRSRYEEFPRRPIVLNPQHVGLAAHLAVFDVVLTPSGGFVDVSQVPFSASRALETRFHKAIMPQVPPTGDRLPSGNFKGPIMAGLLFPDPEAS